MSEWTVTHAQVHQILRQRKLLSPQQRILIALSGGQDSLCLGKLLRDLQPKWGWSLAIAHCDHGWSSDQGIADHVRQIADTWELPFFLKTTSQLRETEASAREWRYRVLQEIAQEQRCSVIVTGHTQSDRAETLLYNLIRGAGGDGLGALTWKRMLTSNLSLIRPLLEISRAQTLQFCQQFQLPIWEDVINQNLDYARNRIRLQVLPQLQQHLNPQVEKALAQTAELLREERLYLEYQSQKSLEKALNEDLRGINRIFLRTVHIALQRRIMRQFWRYHIEQSPTFEQIEELIHLIHAPNRSRTSSFPGMKWAEVRGEWIYMSSSFSV